MTELRLYAEGWKDYELIDAGGGKKLERWGDVITIRPELQAYFKSEKPFTEWDQLAHWEFYESKGKAGKWKRLKKDAPEKWMIKYKRLSFHLEIGQQKHIGLFPEQSVNWDYISGKLQEDMRFLNLFAYTGAASLAAREKQAETYHVDSVKQLISKAKQNMESSNLLNIKWVLEDALKFAEREVKRGNKYQGIIMDPPAWGLGANKEKWKLEDKLEELLKLAARLLDKKGFLILNTYSPAITLVELTKLFERNFKNGSYTISELWMKTQTGKDLFFGNLVRLEKA